jgi:hypothetical protein
VPLRWVLVRDPLGRFDPQALLSTDQGLIAAEVVGYYVRPAEAHMTKLPRRVVQRLREAACYAA